MDEQGLGGVALTQVDRLARAGAAHELDRALGDLLERDGDGPVRLGAGEVQQRVCDPLDLETTLLRKRQPLVRLGAGLDLLEQKLDQAEHAEERVVDLVRDAADELSERGQPTRLEESFGIPGSGIPTWR